MRFITIRKKIMIAAVWGIVAASALNCVGEDKSMVEKSVFSITINQASCNQFERQRLFFAHQSVGYNIIDGVQQLCSDRNLNITEELTDLETKDGVFAHAKVGSNKYPQTKIDEFVKLIDDGVGNQVDYAALKFCFLDVRRNADVDAMLGKYAEAVDTIKKKYPKLKIVHFTVPLTTLQTGWKAVVKKMLNKPVGQLMDNVKRDEYNRKLIDRYKDIDPIFDIAKAESRISENDMALFEYKGNEYRMMHPAMTSDGGHLNAFGKKKVAKDLIKFITSM